jgi:hypothetical protein
MGRYKGSRMIKVTLQVDGVKSSVAQKDGCNLEEVLQVIQQAVMGCGFYPKGNLDFIEDDL